MKTNCALSTAKGVNVKMMNNISQYNSNLRDAVRNAMRDRALYLLFIKREMEKSGIQDVEKILSDAVFNYGKFKAKDKLFQTPRAFLNIISSPLSTLVMKGKVIKDSENEAILKEEYCPLYQAWKEAGCKVQEISQLCRIADCVDIGMVDKSPIEVEFGGNMPEKGEYCQMRITLKNLNKL